jgi:hypothetical protein
MTIHPLHPLTLSPSPPPSHPIPFIPSPSPLPPYLLFPRRCPTPPLRLLCMPHPTLTPPLQPRKVRARSAVARTCAAAAAGASPPPSSRRLFRFQSSRASIAYLSPPQATNIPHPPAADSSCRRGQRLSTALPCCCLHPPQPTSSAAAATPTPLPSPPHRDIACTRSSQRHTTGSFISCSPTPPRCRRRTRSAGALRCSCRPRTG